MDIEQISADGIPLNIADTQARQDITEIKSNLTDNHSWHLIKDNIPNSDTAITIPSGYTELMMTCKHSLGFVFAKVMPIEMFSSSGTTIMTDGYYLSSSNYMMVMLSVTNKATAKRHHQSNATGVSGTWENPSLWGR